MTIPTSTPASTALDIIKRAMRLLGVYPNGEEPGPDESADCLQALNDLLDEMTNTPMVFAKTLDTIDLSAGTSSITVGPSGTVVTDRPAQVLDDSYIDIGTISYPLTVLTQQQYNDIDRKAQTGIPEALWPLMGMPDVTLALWPVPSQACTLKLWSVKVLESFPALNTTVSLPPGYRNALAYMLAEAIAPEFEVPVPAAVAKAAARGRRLIERANFEVPQLSMPPELQSVGFNILTGRFS
jgi:hypothetical protein